MARTALLDQAIPERCRLRAGSCADGDAMASRVSASAMRNRPLPARNSAKMRRTTGAAVASGVKAIFDGIRDASASDEERLERGFVVCDALYAYCRLARDADM